MIGFLKDIFSHKAYNIESKSILDPDFFRSFCQRTDLTDIIKLYQEEENHNEYEFDIEDYWEDFVSWLEYHLAYMVSNLKKCFKHLVKEDLVKVYIKSDSYGYYTYEEDSDKDYSFYISIDKVNWLETYRVNLLPCVCDLKKIVIVI